MKEDKFLLSDEELDQVVGGVTLDEAAAILNNCLASKDGTFVFNHVKYTVTLDNPDSGLSDRMMRRLIGAVRDIGIGMEAVNGPRKAGMDINGNIHLRFQKV